MTVLLLHGWRKSADAAQAREQGWGANYLIGADRLREPNADFGLLTTEDIVYGAMQAYEQNGGNDMSKTLDVGSFLEKMDDKTFDISRYGGMVRAPGFGNIPVCDNLDLTKDNLQYSDPAKSKYWPCNPQEKMHENAKRIILVCSSLTSLDLLFQMVADSHRM